MHPTQPSRFAFMVHPLVRWQRRILGVRLWHLPLLLGRTLRGVDAVGCIGRLSIPTGSGPVDGFIIAIPDTATELATNQQRASALRIRAAEIAETRGVRAIGLGNALAVVAGRGAELNKTVSAPVTTGHACTAWTCSSITQDAMKKHGLTQSPVGIIGFKGTVGDAVALMLRDAGVDVWVTATGRAATRATEIGCRVVTEEQMYTQCPVLVGASTTGQELDGARLFATKVLVDLALPPTLKRGTRPRGLYVYAGEPLKVPGRIRSDLFGWIWLKLANYGRGCIYACLAESVIGAIFGTAYCHTKRRLTRTDIDAAGTAIQSLGWTPVLRRR